MLGEFGAFGALVGFGLIFMQLGEVFGWKEGNSMYIAPVLTAVLAIQATWERLPVPEVLVVHRVRANLEVARIPVILALVGTLGLPHPRRFLATST